MPSSKIFRNRWFAILWAGGILWTAYDVAESAPAPAPAANAAAPAGATDATDATGAAIDSNDLAILANRLSA